MTSTTDLSRYPHVTYYVERFDGAGYGTDGEDRTPTPLHMANVISSEISDGPNRGQHTVALDIDIPARLIQSSTPGHSHLYIDQPMSWSLYAELLDVLARCGVIEPGYVGASVRREHTSLRLPWIKKRPAAPPVTFSGTEEGPF